MLRTRKTLKEAIRRNPYESQYLLEIKERPSTPPGHYSTDDKNGATYYYDASIWAWVHTDDVYGWLFDVSRDFLSKKTKK